MTTIVYQWRRDGLPIAGADGEEYTLVSADVGAIITRTDIATSTGGLSQIAVSNEIGPIEGINDVAWGETVTLGVELIVGEAQGDGVAAGAMLDLTLSLEAGTAVSSDAIGGDALPELGVMLDAGAASTTSQVAGQTLVLGAELIAGAAVITAVAPASLLTMQVGVLPGAATGTAVAAGDDLQLGVIVDPGAPGAGARVAGSALSTSVELVAGSATGAAVAEGATLELTPVLRAGAGRGGAEGQAVGGPIELQVRLLQAGAATAGSVAPGALIEMGAEVIAASVTNEQNVGAASLGLQVVLEPGAAHADVTIAGVTLSMSVELQSATAANDIGLPGDSMVVRDDQSDFEIADEVLIRMPPDDKMLRVIHERRVVAANRRLKGVA
jgi:hypothetical protein